jgi:hypothetical protein
LEGYYCYNDLISQESFEVIEGSIPETSAVSSAAFGNAPLPPACCKDHAAFASSTVTERAPALLLLNGAIMDYNIAVRVAGQEIPDA